MTIGWGFELGFKFGTLTPVQFADRMDELGLDWAALELDDYNGYENWGPFKSALHAKGKKAGAWVTDGANVATCPSDADFVMAELESEGDRQGILGAPTPTIPHFVITNFTPLTDGAGVPLPHLAQPLIERGYECFTEAYQGDSPGMNPDAMNQRATEQLGWARSFPLFGIHNFPIESYDQTRWPIHGYWAAEYLM